MSEKEKAYRLCRGIYQRNLVDGIEDLNGKNLKGKAATYSRRYKRSAENLLERLRKNGVAFRYDAIIRGGERKARVYLAFQS